MPRKSQEGKLTDEHASQQVLDAKYSFIDLFCGIGGFRLAFEKNNGCVCKWSSDWDKFSQITYKENFGETPVGDIHAVAVSDIPSHNILCGGFPCQPFSIAGVSKKNSLGRAHGFADEKQGNLFFSLADIIDFHRPDAFVLENVKNLLGHDHGRTFEVIHYTLQQALQYDVHYKVLDAQHYVPQHRERIFIVGFKKPTEFKFPDLGKDGPRLGSILERDVPSKYILSDRLWSYLQAYAIKHKNAGNGFGYSLVNETSVTRTLSARYYKDGSEILVSRGEGRNPRRLTPRECARLMGYPDSFIIPVSDNQAYRQFGNSVSVPLVNEIARRVVDTLKENKVETI